MYHDALTKSLHPFRVQPLPNIGNTCGAHVFRSQPFLSLSKDWTVPDGVLQYHHTMRVSSRTRRLRNISSVGTRMYVCVYVCRYALRRHDRHRGRAK